MSANDLASLIGKLDALADTLQRQAEQAQQAMTAAATTVTQPEFSLRVDASGAVVSLDFEPSVSQLGPAELGAKVMSAYEEATKLVNGQLSASMGALADPKLAEGIRRSHPQVDDEDIVAVNQSSQSAEEAQPSALRADPMEFADSILAKYGETYTGFELDADEQRFVGSINPHTAQEDLEREVQQIVQAQGDLKAEIQAAEGYAEGEHLSVTCCGAGLLKDVRFRSSIRSTSPTSLREDFALTYAKASQQVSSRVVDIMSQAVGPQDPSRQLFASRAEAARKTIEKIEKL